MRSIPEARSVHRIYRRLGRCQLFESKIVKEGLRHALLGALWYLLLSLPPPTVKKDGLWISKSL